MIEKAVYRVNSGWVVRPVDDRVIRILARPSNREVFVGIAGRDVLRQPLLTRNEEPYVDPDFVP